MFLKFVKLNLNKLLKKLRYQLIERDSMLISTQTLERFLYFERMFKLILGIDGDIVECGVGEGKTFLFLAFLTNKEGTKRNLWGFDSFEGFPEPTIEDNSFRDPKKGQLKKSTVKTVKDRLEREGIDEDFRKNRTHIIKGFFDKSLDLYKGNRIALLHLDVDLYQSYKCTLEKLFPRIVKGGIVLFDEYNSQKFPGATKAINEYFSPKGIKILRDELSDKYYVIKYME